jgi:hypothetical protein
MRAGRDLLGESESRAANDDVCLVRHIVDGHRARIVRPASPGKSCRLPRCAKVNSQSYGCTLTLFRCHSADWVAILAVAK